MPTKRKRVSRTGRLTAEAAAWAHGEDAERFFRNPGAYIAPDANCYDTPIQDLPGVRPWWDPLAYLWLAHLAGDADALRNPEDAAALAFVLELHAEYKAAHPKRTRRRV